MTGKSASHPAILHPKQFQVNRWIWYFILLIGIIDVLWMQYAGMTADVSKVTFIFAVFFGCLLISFIYRYIRRDDAIFMFGQIASQFIAGTAVLGVLSYVSSRFDIPLLDDYLIAIDRFFFFDWREWVHWVDKWPMLAKAFTIAYVSAVPQVLILFFALFMFRQTVYLQRFIIIFFYSGLLVIILAAIFPAVAGYVHYNVDVTQFKNLHPAAARVHENILLGLRNHTLTTIDFPLRGLVTFPSFHSTLAIVYIYACLPLRRLLILMVPLNVLMLVSTMSDGGHYLTDVIGGILVAWPAIIGARWALPYFLIDGKKY